MSNNSEQPSTDSKKMPEDLRLQERQTIALERIAGTLDGIRTEFSKVGDALTRLVNRVGRREDL
jgi:phage-related tail protein